jgi:four helix bundle protein
MENYRRLKVIPKVRALTLLVYRATDVFPRSELYGMTSQMRRAAASIGLAIAEGCGRGTTPDLIRFLHIANASAQELEYAAELSIDLSLGSEAELREVMDRAVEIQKMLGALIRGLTKRQSATPRPVPAAAGAS